MSAIKPNERPPGSLGPRARRAGSMFAISTRLACFAANARSATAASPAHMLYAAINDMPICIADHLLEFPPSHVRDTIVGMCTPCQSVLPIAFFSCSACALGKSLLISTRNGLSISAASSSSPVKTFTKQSSTSAGWVSTMCS